MNNYRFSPMLAETLDDPNKLDWDNWIAELKLDGVRCIAYLNNETKLWGRHDNDLTQKFPELQGIHLVVKKPCVLDGEIVCQSFEGIQRRVHKEKPLDIKIASKLYPAVYEVFDIIYLDGEDLTKKPLVMRKNILEEILDFNLNIRFLPYFFDGVALFETAKQPGWEGIIAKRINSRYELGKRSKAWLKIKNFIEDTFTVIGLTEGEGDRAKTFGSLILAKETESGLVYVGNVGSGFTDEMLSSFRRKFEALKDECPFREKPKLDRELLFWTKPVVKVEVRFLDYDGDKLRFPTFRKAVN